MYRSGGCSCVPGEAENAVFGGGNFYVFVLVFSENVCVSKIKNMESRTSHG